MSTSRAHRPDVGVQVQPEPQPEQDVARVLEPGHSRVAEGAQQDGARLALDARVDLGRVRGPVPQVTVGAQIEGPQLDREAARVAVQLENAHGLRDDLGTDAVPGDDGNELGVRSHGQVVSPAE